MPELRSTEKLHLPLIVPTLYPDERGFFFETWNREAYLKMGLPTDWAQDNVSMSTRAVLRGMHFQNPNAQGKLVQVLRGEVFDVAVDVRIGSPTFGVAEGIRLSDENRKQLFIPEGFAHGFLVTSERALFSYKVSGGLYHQPSNRGLNPFDPALGIDWPTTGIDGLPLDPQMKPVDSGSPNLQALESQGDLPLYNRANDPAGG